MAYNTSTRYKEAISKEVRATHIDGTITTKSNEVITVESSMIASGSFFITNQCVNGEALELGSVFAAEASITLQTEIDRYSLFDAKMSLGFNLKLADGTYERVPLGIFYIDNATRVGRSVSIKAYDGMSLLDVAVDIEETVSGEPFDMLSRISTKTGVPLAQTRAQIEAMANGKAIIKVDNARVSTYRELLSQVSVVLGGFATINRAGALEIRPLGGSKVISKEIEAKSRISTNISDFQISYSKVEADCLMDNGSFKVYSTGTSEAMTFNAGNLSIVQNGDAANQEIVNRLHNDISLINYIPCDISFNGDPSVDLGDLIKIKSGSGDVTSIVTYYKWAYRGSHQLKSAGQNPRIAQAIDKMVQLEKATREFESKVRAISGEMSTVLQTAREVSIKFDTLKIGGRNLLPFKTIRTAGTGYGHDDLIADSETGVITGTGACYLRFDATLEPDTDYTVSVKEVVSNGEYANSLRVNIHDFETGSIVQTIGSLRSGEALTFKTNSNVNEEHAFLIYPASATSASYMIEGLKLEIGNKATDWTPAPEDVDEGILSASKQATDFLVFDPINGLQIGNKQGGAWSGYRAQITGNSYNILDVNGALASRFSTNRIDLGVNSEHAVISLCGEKGIIKYEETNFYNLNLVESIIFEAEALKLDGSEAVSLQTRNLYDSREDGTIPAHESYIGTEKMGIVVMRSSWCNDYSPPDDVRWESSYISIEAGATIYAFSQNATYLHSKYFTEIYCEEGAIRLTPNTDIELNGPTTVSSYIHTRNVYLDNGHAIMGYKADGVELANIGWISASDNLVLGGGSHKPNHIYLCAGDGKGVYASNDDNATVYNLLGAAKALVNTYTFDCTVKPGTNYSAAEATAMLVGGTLRITFRGTRKSATSTGNIADEVVCNVSFNHGGKLKSVYRSHFPIVHSQGTGMINNLSNKDNVCKFNIMLCGVAVASSEPGTYFTLPCTLSLSAFV